MGQEIVINLDIDDDDDCANVPYPTPEQVFAIWENYFEPCLKCSNDFDPSVLATFESDPLGYIKAINI